jgi:FtsH Extracellular
MADAVQRRCSRRWYMRPPLWLLGVVLVGLAILGIVEIISRPAATPYGAFLDQLDAGNVASVTFQGTQINGHFKHPVGGTAANGTAAQDSFRSQAPDFGDPTLLPELRKQHVVIDVASSSSWTRWLGALPWPMLLFLGAIVIAGLVKLVRGGKPSDTAVPTHPMQGMIGLVSGLFGKQDQAAGGPAQGGGEAKSG